MRPELEHLQLLEYHLRGRPTPAEAAAWQLRLRAEPALAAETNAQQLLYAALREAGRQQLRQELTAIHARLYPLHRRFWLGALVAAARRLSGRAAR